MTKGKFIVKWIFATAIEVLIGTGFTVFGFNSISFGWFPIAVGILGCLIFMAAGANVLFGIWFLRFWDFDSERVKRLH